MARFLVSNPNFGCMIELQRVRVEFRIRKKAEDLNIGYDEKTPAFINLQPEDFKKILILWECIIWCVVKRKQQKKLIQKN